MNRRERLLGLLYTVPRDPEIDAKKSRFDYINNYIGERGGWMTSVPGDRDMRFEAMPGSPLPDQLRELGYIVTPVGVTQRVTAGSIVAVETYDLRMP